MQTDTLLLPRLNLSGRTARGDDGLMSPPSDQDPIAVAVVGAHLEGGPLHHQLADRGARLLSRTKTAPNYRLYALDTEPPKPALVRTAQGADGAGAIDVEVWALSPAHFGLFVNGI